MPPLREPDCVGIPFDEDPTPLLRRPALPDREDDGWHVEAPLPDGAQLQHLREGDVW